MGVIASLPKLASGEPKLERLHESKQTRIHPCHRTQAIMTVMLRRIERCWEATRAPIRGPRPECFPLPTSPAGSRESSPGGERRRKRTAGASRCTYVAARTAPASRRVTRGWRLVTATTTAGSAWAVGTEHRARMEPRRVRWDRYICPSNTCHISAMSGSRWSPRHMVSTPGSPSLLSPRWPPRRPIVLVTSRSVGV